jgi:uncharacterized protein DUF3999
MRRAAVLLAIASAAFTAAPSPADFAFEIPLATESRYAVHELRVPDEVYAGVTRRHLGDLRVFNADGGVVEHALCSSGPGLIPPPETYALEVFPLLPGVTPQAKGTTIELRTPDGSVIRVGEAAPPAQAGASVPVAYLIDTRGIKSAISSIYLDWVVTDGRTEVPVRIETSDNLDRWATLVERTTLLRAEAGGRRLERHQLILPEGSYQFLKLSPVEAGVPLVITGVRVESAGASTAADETFWFAAKPSPAGESTRRDLEFTNHRLAPLTGARLKLPDENMVLQVTISSRNDEQAPWTPRSRGQSSAVRSQGGLQLSPPLAFSATSDRFWKVDVTRGAETVGVRPLVLELGYVPEVIRFLAQGPAPYFLVYGSRIAPVNDNSTTACDLLPDDPVGLARLLPARPADDRAVGGKEALNPPPRPTPVRRIILWSILAAGAALVIVMSLSVLRKLKSESSAPPPDSET